MNRSTPFQFCMVLMVMLAFFLPADVKADITSIAMIQAAPDLFEGQIVTVEAQVYIPSNYGGGFSYSGYIQDISGRGINVFGYGTSEPLLENVGDIVRVTGEVGIYFSTVQIMNISEVIVVSSGNPPLDPIVLPIGIAASSSFEGTFIEVAGVVMSLDEEISSTDYTIEDGSLWIEISVPTSLGAPAFPIGSPIAARGAGRQYMGDYQVLVGRSDDIVEGFGFPDTTPPMVVSATPVNETTTFLIFSEPLETTSAQSTANYSLFETNAPGITMPIGSASLNNSIVTLSLASVLVPGTSYTIEVQGVEDLASNEISGAENTVSFVFSELPITPIASIQENSLTYQGQIVKVQAQVYIPSNYSGPATKSGYIQDNSARGINVSGSFAGDPMFHDTGIVVSAVGLVDIESTTVLISILDDAHQISTGNEPLTPLHLGTGASASPDYEGTFIEVTGEVTNQEVSGWGIDYLVDDGSGLIVIRVYESIGAPTFDTGMIITASGAGSLGQGYYNIQVGQAEDIFEGAGPGAKPTILSVLDVPDDQGGWVYVHFEGSDLDQPGLKSEFYSLQRKDGEVWYALASSAVLGDPAYAFLAPTRTDAGPGGDGITCFRVIASMNEGIFISDEECGYSEDNIAPGVPQVLAATYAAGGVSLDWSDAPEDDFQYYRVYRSSDPGFVPVPGNLAQETASSVWIDPTTNPWDYHYKVTVLDHAGNESEPGSPSEVTGVQNGMVPARTTLLGAVPNPFNPSTKLSFEMAAAGHARLKVYDTGGRLVTTLVNERRDAGLHKVIWDGRDNEGRISSAGVYLYRLEVGDFIETKRMTLVK